jgi:WD40 repeat protein
VSAPDTSFYVTGGTLRHDAPSYVERQADRDLSEGLLAGEFCYVLTPRQMGKSSLMVRTASKLREQGVNVIALDLTAIGQNLTPEQWYDGLIARIGRQLRLDEELDRFWRAQERVGPCQRLFMAIRDVVLRERPGPLAIFVDEIDSVRSLPFSTDEFFAAMRECYNRRAEDPELNRVTFCLLGVATPSDLIRDTRTTPFNIGRRIELNDFTEAEAAPLAQGLKRRHRGKDDIQTPRTAAETEAAARTAERLLKRILFWTGGHPYLTQRFCHAVAGIAPAAIQAEVDRLCDELFLSSRAQERDDNLLFVRDRLLRSEADRQGLLELYGKVRRNQQVADDEASLLVGVLRLSGIVKAEGGCLRKRNRIYSAVFDENWIQAHLPDADLRRQRAAFRRGVLRTTGIAAVVVGALTITVLIANHQARKAGRALAESHFAQAKALRVSGLAGQRYESLNALDKARLYHTNAAALRDEALACLALVDLREATNDISQLRGVRLAELSPDLGILAAADESGTISLRGVRSGQLLRTLPRMDLPVVGLRFSPNEPVLVAEYHGPSNGLLVVWDWKTGRQLLVETHGISGNAIDFSADGRKLALGQTNGRVVVHALPGGDVMHEIALKLDSGSPRAPQAVRFDPSGDLLGVCSLDDHYVEIWNLARTQRVARPYHRGVVHDISWHPRGHTLAAACADSTIYLWQTNDFEKPRRLAGHEGRVTAIAYNHRGTFLASLGNDETARLWVPATERQMQRTMSGLDFNRLQFSADDKFLVATPRGQRNALVWEALGDEYVVLQVQTDRSDKLRTIDFSPDGRWLLTATGKETMLWQADSGRELAAIPFSNAQTVRFAADSQHIIACGDTGLFDCALDFREGGDQLRAEIGAVRRMDSVLKDLGGLGTMGLTLDRTTAAVIRSRDVLLVPLTANRAPSLRTIHLGTYYSQVALHPAGTWLATGWTGTNELHLWNLSDAAETPVSVVIPFVEHFVFSPDGQWLATSSGGEFQFYRVGAWTERAFAIPRKLASDQHAPVAFSKDGRVIAVASSRYTIQLFRLPAKDRGQPELIATLESPDRLPLEMLAFSPDGRRLAAATDRQIVQLWNLKMLRDGLVESKLQYNWLDYL